MKKVPFCWCQMDASFEPSVLRRAREFAANVIQRREFELRTQFERDWFAEGTPVQPLLTLLENPKTPPEIQIFAVEILWRRIVRDDGALELLEKSGHTRYWLYKQLGMSYQNFNRMINNQTKSIQYQNIEALCQLLECTPNDLFVFVDD